MGTNTAQMPGGMRCPLVPERARVGGYSRDIARMSSKNGGMFMSVEVFTMLASAATILVALAGGFGWMLTRMDARFVAQDARLDARFNGLDACVGGVAHELSEVKIAIARLEGPQRRPLTSN